MLMRPLNACRPIVRRSPRSSATQGRDTTLSLLTSPCAGLPCTPWWAVLSSGEGSPGLMPGPRWMLGSSSRLSSTNTWVGKRGQSQECCNHLSWEQLPQLVYMCSFFLVNNYFSVKVNVPRNFQDIYKLHTFSVVWEESDSTENTTDGESMPFSI